MTQAEGSAGFVLEGAIALTPGPPAGGDTLSVNEDGGGGKATVGANRHRRRNLPVLQGPREGTRATFADSAAS